MYDDDVRFTPDDDVSTVAASFARSYAEAVMKAGGPRKDSVMPPLIVASGRQYAAHAPFPETGSCMSALVAMQLMTEAEVFGVLSETAIRAYERDATPEGIVRGQIAAANGIDPEVRDAVCALLIRPDDGAIGQATLVAHREDDGTLTWEAEEPGYVAGALVETLAESVFAARETLLAATSGSAFPQLLRDTHHKNQGTRADPGIIWSTPLPLPW